MKAIFQARSVFVLAFSMLLAVAVSAQAPQLVSKDKDKDKPKTVTAESTTTSNGIPLPAPSSESDKVPADDQQVQQIEQEVLPYYENYLKEYRLGPSDQISVEVFGQCPDYCKTGITIPPNARISYPLIREGIMVAGKTVEQVAADITKKLDEFIIDPKVTVTLDKAMATRYAVMGNVAQPGVRVLDHKISVYEAILDAGGVTKNGNKNKIAIVSYTKDRRLERRVVSLADMEMGKTDMIYLQPGDQVYVTGKGFTIDKLFQVLGQASTVGFMVGAL
jgi:polysaccharide export outer membrane protein